LRPRYFDELAGFGEAVDVADQCAQRKGHQLANPTQLDKGKQLRIGQHFLGDSSRANEFVVHRRDAVPSADLR